MAPWLAASTKWEHGLHGGLAHQICRLCCRVIGKTPEEVDRSRDTGGCHQDKKRRFDRNDLDAGKRRHRDHGYQGQSKRSSLDQEDAGQQIANRMSREQEHSRQNGEWHDQTEIPSLNKERAITV